MIEDKTLDFVAHVNGELQDVLLRGACRCRLVRCSVSSPSSSEAEGPPVGSLLVPPI